jgi:hypothetical protein
MPWNTEWIEPEVAVEHNGRTVWHTYKGDDVDSGRRTYCFTTSKACGERSQKCGPNCPHVFDIRELYREANELDYLTCREPIRKLVKRAIDDGKLHFDEENEADEAEQGAKETKIPNDYVLLIDGPLFRRQRELLIALADEARNSRQVRVGPEQATLLEGLVELTDSLADQAYEHGIDCLIVEVSQE